MSVTIRYFARMADIAGCAHESMAQVPATAAELFAQLSERHRFGFGIEVLRVAINDRLVSWQTALSDGDEIAFIPPVSGG